MNYKFIQPVSMQVNQEQFEYLSKELEKLGYTCKNCMWTNDFCFIVTNYNYIHNHFSNYIESAKYEKNRYFIDHHNPELFLALAAMTNNPSRRATKEEIIAGFTKKEEFVLPEKWYIKITKENKDILSKWRRTTRNPAGKNLDHINDLDNISQSLVNICSDNKWTAYCINNDEIYGDYSDYKEITLEQFKKYVLKTETMNKKIIGYKAPYDIYTETAYFKINRGDLLVKDSSPLYYKCVNWKVGECEKYLLAKEIVETWEPVYEEDKKLKIFTLDCIGGRFELEVSTDGILYRPDSAYLNPSHLSDFILCSTGSFGMSLSAKGRSENYKCQFSHIDLGCKKSVPIIKLKEVVDYYNSIKL